MKRLGERVDHDTLDILLIVPGKVHRTEKMRRYKNGRRIVKINNIRFKGKRKVDWSDVESYLSSIVGEQYSVENTGDIINIGNEFPSEFSGSIYTYKLKGTVAKAKANSAQAIREIIEIAEGGHHRDNVGDKHKRNAAHGWYRYDSRFALPVFNEDGSVLRYNAFHASLIVRHSNDGKKYLYDFLDIKKETSNPFES